MFKTKSGDKKIYTSGVGRSGGDKTRYDLIPIFMLKRLAELYGRGASIYGENNWKKASTQEDLDRFKQSALRHLYQYLDGEVDEDHISAVFFNLIGAEHTKNKL